MLSPSTVTAGWCKEGIRLFSQSGTGQEDEVLNCTREVKLDIRRKFFTETILKHWKALPREVEPPSLNGSRTSWT